MKERPILFSSPMIRALLAGTKTVTRRIVKLPADTTDVVIDRGGTAVFGPGPYVTARRDPSPENDATMHPRIYCPYGYPGDRLWVKETHAAVSEHGDERAMADAKAQMPWAGIIYRADPWAETPAKWRPSIFMPRWASRITLDIVSVRGERLHEIDELESLAEGVSGREVESVLDGKRGTYTVGSARDEYAQLWREINGAASWDADPWVWRVEFKRGDAAARAA